MAEPFDSAPSLRERAERIVKSLPTIAFDPSLVAEGERLSPWHEAAAVLSTFQISELRPAAPTSVLREELLAGCTLTAANRCRWILRPDLRVAALRQLGTRRQMQRALEANPTRPDDALQRVFEVIIRGEELPIESLGIAELSAAAQATEWLGAILDKLPQQQAIVDRLDVLRLLEPFEHLVGVHFQGRKKELAALGDYVGVLSAASVGEAIKRGLEATIMSYERPPLMIVAAGGAGKSTLIARFILDHAQAAAEERFPFAYLDFDRPSIFAEEPVSILIEAVRQIGIEYPHARGECEALRRAWQAELPATTGSDGAASSRDYYRRARVVLEFAQLIHSLGAADKPVLLVLDTFEEVQYASSLYLENLWTFIRLLQQELPRVRFILAGRTPLSGVDVRRLDLPDLEESAANGFLRQRGIAPEAAAAVVKQVGRNPLSLRLAAAVLESEKAGKVGIEKLDTRRLFRRIEAAEIQGQLFKRILDHIHDDDVRRLAYPGLVLRRITPELIEGVLAQPCGVRIDSPSRANELFDELGREMSLVTPAADGALVHRSDVRRLMLPLLEASDAERMRVIEEKAVRFYERSADVTARVEEIYHRLRLRQPRDVIEERWISGIEPFLRSVVDEMTPAGRLLLSEHGLGPPPDKEMIRKASQEEWERAAKIEAENLISNREADRALKVLRTRKERLPGSDLFLIEARVLCSLGLLDEATQAARRAIDEYSKCNARLLFRSYLFLAEVAMFRADYATADEALPQARQIAEEYGDRAGRIAVAVHRVTLHDARGSDAAESVAALRTEFGEAEDVVLAAHPELVRDAVRILGAAQPEIVARALRVVGFATPPDSGWRTLLAVTLRGVPGRIVERMQGDATLRRRLEDLDDRAGSWQGYAMSAPAGDLASWLADLLDLCGAAEAQLLSLVRDAATRVETSTGSSTEWTFETLGSAPEPDPKRGRRRASGALREAIASSLSHAFRLDELELMLAATMNRRLAGQDISEVIETASRQGWLQEFLAAAARWWPANELVLKAVDAAGAGIVVAPWSNRKLGTPALAKQRLGLARIDGALCAMTLRRRVVATGVLVAPDIVVAAAGESAEALGRATIRFPAAVGTAAVSTRRMIANDDVAVIHLGEPAGEHLIDGAGSLRRGTIALDGAEAGAGVLLAAWRSDVSRLTIASIDVAGSDVGRLDRAAAGAACFDSNLAFAGFIRIDSSDLRLVSRSSVRKAVEASLEAGKPELL